MNIGVAILAYGNEHINEANMLLDNFMKCSQNIHFYVGTDQPNLIRQHERINLIKITEEFNYNLKKIPLQHALMEHNCVILTDSDVYVKNDIDFSFLNEIEDGLYFNWYSVVNENMTLSSEIEYEYITKLKESIDDDLFFINESTLLFKIDDQNKKISLLENWDNLYNETRHLQPTYRNVGAVEGVIIYKSCLNSNLKPCHMSVDKKIETFFNNFLHYRDTPIKLNKEII